jgi:hypothetical protein
MTRRPRGGSNSRSVRGGGRGGGGLTPPPPTGEAPELIPDLAAWYDSRTDAYFALSGASVTAWMSRAGSLGAAPLAQGTGSNQPLRANAVGVLNGQQSVQFDTPFFLQGAVPADWSFLHDNTGATIVTVEYVDSTGAADQYVVSTYAGTAATVGVVHQMRLASFSPNIGNGSGTYQQAWSNATATHFARNVARWRAWSYGAGVQTSRVSTSALTNNDTIGQTPSAAAPLNALRLSRNTIPLKGFLPQVVIYKRVITLAECNALAAFFAPIYGVAA